MTSDLDVVTGCSFHNFKQRLEHNHVFMKHLGLTLCIEFLTVVRC